MVWKRCSHASSVLGGKNSKLNVIWFDVSISLNSMVSISLCGFQGSSLKLKEFSPNCKMLVQAILGEVRSTG